MNKNASVLVRTYTIVMFMAMPTVIFVGIATLLIHAIWK
jgi:hypothetical protein